MIRTIFNLITALSLFLCALADIRSYRIPNRLIWIAAAFCLLGQWVSSAGGNLPCYVWESGGAGKAMKDVLAVLGRMVLAVGVSLPFHMSGMIGGGDSKIMALSVGWLGFGAGVQAIGIGLVLGAILALGKMLRHGSMARRFLYLSAYIRRTIREKKIHAYYDADRDGRDCVIPLGACICARIFLKRMRL